MNITAALTAIVLLALGQTFGQVKKPDPAPSAPSAGVTEQAVNGFLQHMFGYDSNLKWQIAKVDPQVGSGLTQVIVVVTAPQGQQTLSLFVTPDGKNAVTGDLVPFGADPFAASREILHQADGPVRGPADAPLRIVEFGDLQCPSCKQAQSIVQKLLADVPNAQLVFENYPLPQHDWAMKAARYGECLAHQSSSAYWKFEQSVFDAQSDITKDNADAKLKELVTAAGGNAGEVAACSAKPETDQRVKASMKLGQELGVSSTPTFFINGRKFTNVAGMPYELLVQIVKFQATLPKD